MDIPEKIFKAYDIRGIYPDEINEENVVSITRAIFKLYSENLNKDKLTLAVGQDMRLSSPKIFKAVTQTLVDLGVDVVDIGLVSTPTLYFATFHLRLDGGIMISASHNPGNFNGIKMVQKSDSGLMKIGANTGMDKIKKWSIEGVDLNEPQVKGEVVQKDGVVVDEVKNALKIAGNPQIKPYKVVADTANAMGSVYIEELFEHIPGELVKMNFDLDGNFPSHPADPLIKENVADLQKRVLEEKADLGIATDGDGDRIFFVDEKGQIIPASLIISLIAKELLAESPGETVVIDIRYILNSKKVIEKHGGKFEIVRVGHAYITEKLNQVNGIFAGESSGHMFFRDTGGCESGVSVIAVVLAAMSKENRPISEIVNDLKHTHESGEVNFELSNAPEVIEVIKQKYSDAEISTLDGVAINYPDVRFGIRTSNTGIPLLRLNVEGYNEEKMKKTTEEVIALIEQHLIKDPTSQSGH